uniref:RING-type domain-containing protein n=1 Tax=Panagrolaimus sp. JU765 TaxID=591449 RepID=A0AC34RID9_9BILA
MGLFVAETSEVVRSHLRDEEHLDELSSRYSQLVSQIFGRRGVIVAFKWQQILMKALYYGLTTGTGVQTLGEEYLGLIQVDGSNSDKVATDFQRYAFIFVECSQNFICSKLCAVLCKYGKQLHDINHLHPVLYKITQDLPAMSDAIVEFFKTFNIALFYLFGTPYHQISKAIVDIRYRSLRPQSNFEAQTLYKILGITSFFRLLFVAKKRIEKFIKENEELDGFSSDYETEEQINIQNTITCSVCCEIAQPVATPCGHSFCWNCVERTKVSTDSKDIVQCPSCRYQFLNTRVIPLMNL